MSDVRFVPMTHGDLAWVADAEQQIYSFPWTWSNFADSLSAGYSCWIMHYDGTPAGYAIQMQILDEAHLLNISVLPQLQRRGLGSLLLDHLCESARRFGATQMFLEVRESNHTAQALYRKWGFTQIGRRKGYYPSSTGREDAVVMRRGL